MCAHYENVKRQDLLQQFGVPNAGLHPAGLGKDDVWPSYEACMIRRPPELIHGDDAVPRLQAVPARFGLIPSWANDESYGRRTYNARSETVAEKPSFRGAWKAGQRCIIPARAIYEPNWSTGKAQSTRIERADGQAMAIAGIWSSWRAPNGLNVLSFSMLTVNAQDHDFMKQFHKPMDEKRMVVILEHSDHETWLDGSMQDVIPLIQCTRSSLVRANS
jgi:putative SOS response-associated peptidase YedK